MDNNIPEFEELSQEGMDRLSALAKKNEGRWLLEYIEHLNNDRYWDVDFIDYKCYKVFMSEYKENINHYRDEFIKKGGEISLTDAGWGLYFMATNQEDRLINEPAEA